MKRLTLIHLTLAVALLVGGPAVAQLNLPDAVTDADYYDDGAPDPAKVELGRFLFFDKILSGTRTISCATCHHPFAGTSDGLSLPVGEGASGVSTARDTGVGDDAIVNRVPRNAPHLFNLGAREFGVMFHDGRLFADPNEPSGFFNPAGDDLPTGLDNVLAAQAMFPVTSPTEMAGQDGESPVSNLAAIPDLPALWDLLAQRLQNEPPYVDLFVAAFDDVDEASDITFVHAANAIAAYEAETWRSDDSLYDRALRGERDVLSPAQKRGGVIFYTTGGCAACHSGAFQTDQSFHAIAVPQIGPGKGDGFEGREDFGLERVTLDSADRYKFRTPTLRNVELTAPYGHDGAYKDLRAMIEHHLDPEASIAAYVMADNAVLPSRADLDAVDGVVQADAATVAAIAAANELDPISAHRRRDRRPDRVPAHAHRSLDARHAPRRADLGAERAAGLRLIRLESTRFTRFIPCYAFSATSSEVAPFFLQSDVLSMALRRGRSLVKMRGFRGASTGGVARAAPRSAASG